MYLIVDSQSQRQANLQNRLHERGAVHACESWSQARKYIESENGTSLKYVFVSESVLKAISEPQKEFSDLAETFLGLWVFVSEDPDSLFQHYKPRFTGLRAEYWSPQAILSKLEYLDSLDFVEGAEAQSANCLVSESVNLSEVGIVNEKPSSSVVGCFSPEAYARGDLMILASEHLDFESKAFQVFRFATSGALREVYQRVQKDDERELARVPSAEGSQQVPAAVWITPGPSDLDSLAEFFPAVAWISLPHLGLEEGSSAVHKGQKDFFFDSKPGQLASFKLDRETLNVSGFWGSELKKFHKFLGRPLTEITGTCFPEMISSTDRDRFWEVVAKLKTVRPIVNYFEMLDSAGELHIAELLMDYHRDGDEEFLLLRVNPFVGEIDDHMLSGHERGLLPPDWPRWVILPHDEWRRVGGSEAVQSRLENSFRRPQGAPDASVWLIAKSPLKADDILELLSSQVECVWTSPLPFRLMARIMHNKVGGPDSEIQTLQVHWSRKPHTLYFRRAVEIEQTYPEGIVLKCGEPWQVGQTVLVGESSVQKNSQGFRWGRVVHCQGERAKVSWLVQNAG